MQGEEEERGVSCLRRCLAVCCCYAAALLSVCQSPLLIRALESR